MARLSDTQLVILTTACQRADRRVLPLPERLKGGAANKVIDSLAAKGFIEEVDAKHGDPVWRKKRNGHGVTLAVTDSAFEALGIEAESTPASAAGCEEAPAATEPEPTTNAEPAPVRKTRADSKQAKLIEMLKRPGGATIDEIVTALDWQSHTVRGAIAGALKKKLGLTVTSEKIEERGRVYRIG